MSLETITETRKEGRRKPTTPAPVTLTLAQEMAEVERELAVVKPDTVLAWAAANPGSVLYSRFNWDDNSAGHQYRLAQARTLIATVVIQRRVEGEKITVKAFKSLTDNRGASGNYESTVHVLSNRERRHRLLIDTIKRLWSIENLHLLKELAGVRDAVARLRNEYPEAAA